MVNYSANATFTNNSVTFWPLDLLVEETGVPGENCRRNNVLSSTPHHQWDLNSQLWW